VRPKASSHKAQSPRFDVSAFLGPRRWPTTSWGSNFPKMTLCWLVMASTNGIKTNDFIKTDVIRVTLSPARCHWSSGVYYL